LAATSAWASFVSCEMRWSAMIELPYEVSLVLNFR